MEHRQKRPRLDDGEGPVYSPAASPPLATASAAPDAASETAQDTSMPLNSEPARTPDKFTWQGWAEIENDPVCPYLQMSGLPR